MNFLTDLSGLSNALKMLLPQGSDSVCVYISPLMTPGICPVKAIIRIIYERVDTQMENDLKSFRQKREFSLSSCEPKYSYLAFSNL